MERSPKYNLIAGRVLGLLTERYWGKVVKTDGCWLWTGATEVGYPTLNIPGQRNTRVGCHIFAWFLANGRWPGPDKLICHTRNCTSKECTRPDHLYEGNHRTNALDRYAVAEARAKEAA